MLATNPLFTFSSDNLTVHGPFEFNLTYGHNKLYFDECSSWPNIPKGSLAVIGLPESGMPAAKIAHEDLTSALDFELVAIVNVGFQLQKLTSGANNRSLYFQIISLAQPEDIWCN